MPDAPLPARRASDSASEHEPAFGVWPEFGGKTSEQEVPVPNLWKIQAAFGLRLRNREMQFSRVPENRSKYHSVGLSGFERCSKPGARSVDFRNGDETVWD